MQRAQARHERPQLCAAAEGAGYPAVMVTDTAWYRYPHYHAPTATPEKLDFAAMARVTTGLADAVTLLAN
jgi:hypothetical protein